MSTDPWQIDLITRMVEGGTYRLTYTGGKIKRHTYLAHFTDGDLIVFSPRTGKDDGPSREPATEYYFRGAFWEMEAVDFTEFAIARLQGYWEP